MKDQPSPYRDDASGSANVCGNVPLGRTGNDLCARHQPITQRVGRKEARMRAHILRAPPNLAERVEFECGANLLIPQDSISESLLTAPRAGYDETQVRSEAPLASAPSKLTFLRNGVRFLMILSVN